MPNVSANSILLVDDDPAIRALLSRRLVAAGFKVRQAEDGIDGLVKLREEVPELIISDLQMPRMAGIEFISVVRRRFSSLPVIALSGAISSEFPAEARPDAAFEKSALLGPELLGAVRNLTRNAPAHAVLPPVMSVPLRITPGVAGDFLLTCLDCLRQFQVTSMPEDETVQRTAICTHCEASVPFLVGSPETAPPQ